MQRLWACPELQQGWTAEDSISFRTDAVLMAEEQQSITAVHHRRCSSDGIKLLKLQKVFFFLDTPDKILQQQLGMQKNGAKEQSYSRIPVSMQHAEDVPLCEGRSQRHPQLVRHK
ncbi:hypothetical protein RHGRI_010967 [Rhododendron griersonianum]|uniref:Uncharacterized protein n=1 Tax=Rhododendron griersonianum TaxID=479676 RepID=A0AAV6KK88_9ERIC|nr:hypothetical protein RHGRI_010967 [Rhododendron griersonianum]